MLRIMGVMGIILMLSACSLVTVGTDFSWKDVDTIQIGDTQEKVVQIMKSEPYSTSTGINKDGQQIETYIWVIADGSGKSKAASFKFVNGSLSEIGASGRPRKTYAQPPEPK